MKREIFLSIFIAALISLAAACGGGTSDNINSNLNAKVTNANANASNHGSMTTVRNEEPTENNAPTLAPVVQAYYAALEKKDDAAIRRTLSSDFIKTLETDMKAEKKSNLVAYLNETESVPEQPVEVRNEQINGNKGVAEIRGGVYKTWTPFSFANEGGKWKLTGGSSDLQTVQQSTNK